MFSTTQQQILEALDAYLNTTPEAQIRQELMAIQDIAFAGESIDTYFAQFAQNFHTTPSQEQTTEGEALPKAA